MPQNILKDKGKNPQLGKAAARDIPNCRRVELAQADHIPHLEAPDRFHQAWLDFLQEQCKPAS